MSESFNVFDRASNRVLRRRVNRRRMLQASALAGVGAAGFALVGCGDDDDEEEAATTQAEQAAAAEAPAAEAPAAEAPAAEAPAAEAPAAEGFAAATPDKVPPKSTKDTIVIATGALPLGGDGETAHGNPASWEEVANLGGGMLRWGWQKYPFDRPPEGIGTDYMSFNQDEIQTGLIESWENSEDLSSTVFHFRQGVKSFNGNELTSADMQYKIDRLFGLQAIGAFFASILNLDASNPIEIVDKYSYKLNSTGPQFLLAPINANPFWGILDSTEAKKFATEDDPWVVTWARTVAQNFGAYGITVNEPGNQVVWSANPNYWRGVPPIKTVIYKEIPSPSNRFAAIQAGETDIANDLPAELWLQARDQKIQRPYAVIGNFIVFGFMNSLRDPFKDPRTRQAFNWATPRRDIIDTAFGGLGEPWLSTMTSIYPGNDPSTVPWTDQADFTTAKQLLDAAGQGDGFDITLEIDSSVSFYERIAVLLQDALSNVDVNVSISPQANAQYAAEATGKQKTFALWQDVYIQPDPMYFLNLGYDAGLGGINNYGQLDDPELNRLLDQGKLLTTLDERVVAATAIQKRAAELSGYLWLAEPWYTNIQATNLQGFRWHTILETDFSDMYFT